MKRSPAFSLVEVSIVLVIIGLLVGGVLTGQSLIRSSTLNAFAKQARSYASATQQFNAQYGSLPGDLPTATKYWGIAAGTAGNDSTCQDATVTTRTCNGNGSRLISGLGELNERFRFWQHLALAGMIPGQYTGTAVTSGTNQTKPGSNVPTSALPNSGFSAYSEVDAPTIAAGFYNVIAPNNIISTGTQIAGSDTYGPNLTPEDAYNVDKKFDDGLPAYGSIQGYKKTGGVTPNCTTSDTATSAAYSLDQKGLICGVYFFLTDTKL